MAVDSSGSLPPAANQMGRRQRWNPARRQTANVEAEQTSGIAFGLYIIFIGFTLLSIPSRVPILGVVRPTILLVAVITAMIFLTSGVKKNRDASKTTRLLVLFTIFVLFAIPFVEWPGSVLRFGIEGYLKVVVFFFFTVQLVDSFARLRVFILTVVICQVWRVLEPLYLHLTTGYWGSQAHMGGGDFMARLSGAPHDIINPNGLAFVILTVLPFLHYLFGGSQSKFAKLLYLILGPALLYAFVLTGSRSGMVGLAVIIGVIIFKSRHRMMLAGVVTVGAILLAGVMSSDMKDRYVSLVDADTRHGATREGRMEGVKSEVILAMRRPIFGHGLSTSREAMVHFVGSDQISHNLYTEVLIETGLPGLLIIVALLVSIVRNVLSAHSAVNNLRVSLAASLDRALHARFSYYNRCADATLTWVLMCLVFSLASYGLLEFYWYMIAGLSVCLLNLVTAEQASSALTGAPPNRNARRVVAHDRSTNG